MSTIAMMLVLFIYHLIGFNIVPTRNVIYVYFVEIMSMIRTQGNIVLNRIYLWGFMGSGKSTIGKELAKRLDFQYIDLDEMLEHAENLSVLEIFVQKGEEYFRNLEHETLKELLNTTQNLMLSTGGGTPCFFDNADIMNKSGVTIYLNVSAKTLKSRLKKDAINSRPLVMNSNWTEVLDLFQERQKYYNTAQIILSNDQNIDKCIDSIMRKLEELK